MAPAKDTQATEPVDVDDKTLMLKEALKCVNGNLDFDKLAEKLGVANAAAMRKRFKRFFEKDEEPIQVFGNTLGGSVDGGVDLKTPQTPKPKTIKPVTRGDGDGEATHTNGKKRSSDEAQGGEDEHESNGETTTTAENSAKKPRSTVKAPRTPRTPKSPKVPKAPRTPKSTASTKVSKIDKSKATDSDGGDELHGSENTKEAESKKSKIGSPALQAKTDAAIKEAESENSTKMGEPAKQAKRDAIEMDTGADGDA